MMQKNIYPKVKIQILNEDVLVDKIYGLINQTSDINFAKKLVLDIDDKLIKEIWKKNFEKVKNKILIFIHKKRSKNLAKNLALLQSLWDKENDLYFYNLKEFFDIEIKDETFFCYLTDRIVGNYGLKNDFVVRINDDLKNSIYIMKEEIFHLIYWRFWRKIFHSKNKMPFAIKNEKKFFTTWKISELLPEYAFFLHAKNREKSFPWLFEVKNLTDSIFKNSENLKEFIIKLHKLNKIDQVKGGLKNEQKF